MAFRGIGFWQLVSPTEMITLHPAVDYYSVNAITMGIFPVLWGNYIYY